MYYDTQKRLVSNKVVLKGEYHLTMASELVYSAARKAFVLTGEESVAAILKRVLNSRTFPADPNGVYSIISDNNIFQVRHRKLIQCILSTIVLLPHGYTTVTRRYSHIPRRPQLCLPTPSSPTKTSSMSVTSFMKRKSCKHSFAKERKCKA